MTRQGPPDGSGRKDGEAHTGGPDSIDGTGPANGSGVMAGPGPTDGSAYVEGSGPILGHREVKEGLTNRERVGEVGGLEERSDLINGLPAKPREMLEDPPSGWGRSARKRRAAREALSEKAAVPMPGDESGP